MTAKRKAKKTAEHDEAKTSQPLEEIDVASPEGPDETAEAADELSEWETEPSPEPKPAPLADVTEPEPDPLEDLKRERDEVQDRWLRAVAELDNLRRRKVREVDDARRLALVDVFRRLLDVQDDFGRALASIPGPETDGAEGAPVERLADLRHGIELIHQRFLNVLKDFKIEPIAALGEQFDPRLHEAVGHREREGAESGDVVDVLQDGYMLGETVLRPSRVLVAP